MTVRSYDWRRPFYHNDRSNLSLFKSFRKLKIRFFKRADRRDCLIVQRGEYRGWDRKWTKYDLSRWLFLSRESRNSFGKHLNDINAKNGQIKFDVSQISCVRPCVRACVCTCVAIAHQQDKDLNLRVLRSVQLDCFLFYATNPGRGLLTEAAEYREKKKLPWQLEHRYRWTLVRKPIFVL